MRFMKNNANAMSQLVLMHICRKQLNGAYNISNYIIVKNIVILQFSNPAFCFNKHALFNLPL